MNRPPYDVPGALMQVVLKQLRDDPRSTLEIHKDTNIPYYWLKKFIAGEYKNPSVNRIEYLYTRLTGKTLEV